MGGFQVRTTVAELTARQLEVWGIRNVYGVIGEANLAFVDAVNRSRRLRFINVRNEESATLMASAEAKLTGRPGVCTATAGPGTAHLVNGLADARFDRVPVIAITGQIRREFTGLTHEQFVNQQVLLNTVSDYSAELQHPDALPYALGEVYRTAVGRGTVAHLGVPSDLWERESEEEFHPAEPFLDTPAVSSEAVILGAVRLLEGANRPVIMIGRGARNAVDTILRLADKLSAAIVFSLGANGLVSMDNSLVVGGIGEAGSEAAHELIQESDMVFRIGSSWWPSQFVPRRKSSIDVNIRPEHIGVRKPSSYGVVGPVEHVLPLIEAHVGYRPRPEWRNRIEELGSRWRARLNAESQAEHAPGGLVPARVLSTMMNEVPSNAIITLDSGEHVLWFNRHFCKQGTSVLMSGYWRTMGFALPAAIAAKLANPERPVIAFCGDGGFSMVMEEFLTAVHHRTPVTVVISHNHALAMEKDRMIYNNMSPFGTDLHNPDFARYAELCGGRGWRVEHAADLAGALASAFSSNVPSVVDVMTAQVPVETLLRRQPAMV